MFELYSFSFQQVHTIFHGRTIEAKQEAQLDLTKYLNFVVENMIMMMIFVINVFRRQGCPHLGQGHGPIVENKCLRTLLNISVVSFIQY